MFPWMPNATMAGNLSLLSLMMGSGAPAALSGGASPGSNPQAYWARLMSPQPFSDNQGDRSDQTPQGNQPDTGNTMAPPGQQPPGGPDNTPMSGYDYNTVSPGYAPSPLMQWFRGMGGGRSPSQQQQRGMQQMGLLGLSMLQPRQPTRTGPYPWI